MAVRKLYKSPRFRGLSLYFDRSDTGALIREMRKGNFDQAALAALSQKFTHAIDQVPERHLWWLVRVIDVRNDPENGDTLKSSLFSLYRSANWELQRRYRAV